MVAWTPLAPFNLPARPIVEPWIMALEDFGNAPAYLKIKATGEWTAMAGLSPCGPDGLTGQSLSNEQLLLLTDCPVGALIGRVGGSSATLKSASPPADSGESKPFAVGSVAVVKLPDKAVGPLYLSFNILLRPIDLKSLKVEISAGS